MSTSCLMNGVTFIISNAKRASRGTVCIFNTTIRYSSDKHKNQGLNNIHVLQIALKSSNDR